MSIRSVRSARTAFDPAFGIRVHSRTLRGRLLDLDTLGCKDSVERVGELAVAIPDQEAERCAAVTEVRDKVPGQLGHPGRIRIPSDTKDANLARPDLDHEKYIDTSEIHEIYVEKVACQQSFRVRTQESLITTP